MTPSFPTAEGRGAAVVISASKVLGQSVVLVGVPFVPENDAISVGVMVPAEATGCRCN